MNKFRLIISLLAVTALAPAVASADPGNTSPASPLVMKIRAATAKYQDVNAALADGYGPSPCVSGPDTGAMGIHYIKGALLGDETVNADTPEALMYEPLPGGGLRLVAVEYIMFADNWGGGMPAVEGHLMNYEPAPNRFGIPAFFALHVWAWKHNPNGTFADWNPNVSCDAQPLTSP